MPDENRQPTPAQPAVRRARRLFVALLLILFAGPLLISWGRNELSEWSLAASYEQQLQGHLDVAGTLLDGAIRWSPERSELYARRAHVKISSGDALAALPDCDRAVVLAREERSRFQPPVGQRNLAIALNQRAYAYALCERNLEQALQNINEAIELTSHNESFLDTRGYIYLLMDRLDEAQADLEMAVRLAEANYKPRRNEYLKQLRSAVDKRPLTRLLKELDEMFAVLYHHRGELYQKLGRSEDAEADFARADRLGYDPARGVW